MSMFAFNVAASDHRHSASFLSRTSSMVLHGEPNVHQAARKPVSTPRNQSCQKDIWSIQRASFNTTDTNHYIATRVWRIKQAITDRLSFTGFRVREAQVPAVLVGSLGFCHQDELNQGGLGGVGQVESSVLSVGFWIALYSAAAVQPRHRAAFPKAVSPTSWDHLEVVKSSQTWAAQRI